MGEAYRIGVYLGGGAGIGVLAAGLLARSRFAVVVAVGTIVAAAIGILFFLVVGMLVGAAGGLIGSASAAQFARGGLRRGGTRGGTALLVGGAGIALVVLALVPVVGYLEAIALPLLALRARRRAGEKYAGLRTLAR